MTIKIGEFYRTCQECGHQQKAVEPKGNVSEAWRNVKCRKCKSEALDYGTTKTDPNDDWAK